MQLLVLIAPKVVTHCSHGQLENVADLLWVPLFQNSEDSEEITRNVAAACLGKLATTAPSRYLPQLRVGIGNLFGGMTTHVLSRRNGFMIRALQPAPRSSPPSVIHS